MIAEYCHGKRVIVCGSTWAPDEDILLEFFLKNRLVYPDLRLVLVPHEISESHIQKLMDKCPGSIRFSQTNGSLPEAPLLIIDTIGMLSKTYAYAHIAYVGGGFGAGIHNLLEPAAFGVPVIFGPKHQKFREAGELISNGGAWSINGQAGLSAKITALLDKPDLHASASAAAGNYVKNNAGATRIIGEYLSGNL
jgi:3-deoxy-D-manno-octulosonic-acid transferase